MSATVRGPRGFTLVEVLVALVLMAVIAALGWRGVDGMVRARDGTARANRHTLQLSAAMGQWEADLQQVYDSPQVPGLGFDGGSLRLVRRAPEGVDGSAGVQVVVWSLREGALWRWQSPPVKRQGPLREAWMQSLQLQGGEAGQVRAIDGVTGWGLLFARQGRWTNPQSSGDVRLTLEEWNARRGASAPVVASSAPAQPPKPSSSPADADATPKLATATIELPQAVRLVLQLPAGALTRDVLVARQAGGW